MSRFSGHARSMHPVLKYNLDVRPRNSTWYYLYVEATRRDLILSDLHDKYVPLQYNVVNSRTSALAETCYPGYRFVFKTTSVPVPDRPEFWNILGTVPGTRYFL
jgi:hypothetical protein